MAKHLASIAVTSALLTWLFFPVAEAKSESKYQDVILVLDNSGSMHKIDPSFSLRGAIERFVREADAQENLGIVIFDKNANLVAPLAPLVTTLSGALNDSLNQINYRGRYTNTAAGIERGMEELRIHGRSDAVHTVILLTDGVIDTGDKSQSIASARRLSGILTQSAVEHEIRIYTIALGAESDTQLLQTLATTTHGGYYHAATASDLAAAFSEIGTTLRHPVTNAVSSEPAGPAAVTQHADTPPVAVAQTPQTADSAAQIPAPTAKPVTETVAETAPADQKVGSTGGWQSLPPLTSFPLGWLIIISLAVAVLELGLFLRRRLLVKPVKKPTSPTITPQPDFVPEAYLHDKSGIIGQDSFPLRTVWTLIGRQHMESNAGVDELIIASSTIGRQHATIQYRDHGFWLTDRRSRNGTFVNGTRITDAVCLKHGDSIRFHDFEFQFMLGCLADSDETIVSSNLSRWGLDPFLPKEAARTTPTAAITDRTEVLSQPQSAPAPTPRQATPTESNLMKPEHTPALEDITLPSDDAVRIALDKYFEASNF